MMWEWSGFVLHELITDQFTIHSMGRDLKACKHYTVNNKDIVFENFYAKWHPRPSSSERIYDEKSTADFYYVPRKTLLWQKLANRN